MIEKFIVFGIAWDFLAAGYLICSLDANKVLAKWNRTKTTVKVEQSNERVHMQERHHIQVIWQSCWETKYANHALGRLHLVKDRYTVLSVSGIIRNFTFLMLTNKKLLVWKWFLCELWLYITTLLTIDNEAARFPKNFANVTSTLRKK